MQLWCFAMHACNVFRAVVLDNLKWFSYHKNGYFTHLHAASPCALSSHIPPFWHCSRHLCPKRKNTLISTLPHSSLRAFHLREIGVRWDPRPLTCANVAHLSIRAHMHAEYHKGSSGLRGDEYRAPGLCFVAPAESHWPFVRLWITDFDGGAGGRGGGLDYSTKEILKNPVIQDRAWK